MNQYRPVMVRKYFRPEGAKYNDPYEVIDVEEGVFHQWGVEYEEFENGAVNYTVAIVEMPDGTIQTPIPQLIRFLDILVPPDGG